MYYTARLYESPSIKFEIEEVEDKDDINVTKDIIFGFGGNNGCGIEITKKTKKSAISALRKHLKERRKELVTKIEEVDNLLMQII